MQPAYSVTLFVFKNAYENLGQILYFLMLGEAKISQI